MNSVNYFPSKEGVADDIEIRMLIGLEKAEKTLSKAIFQALGSLFFLKIPSSRPTA